MGIAAGLSTGAVLKAIAGRLRRRNEHGSVDVHILALSCREHLSRITMTKGTCHV